MTLRHQTDLAIRYQTDLFLRYRIAVTLRYATGVTSRYQTDLALRYQNDLALRYQISVLLAIVSTPARSGKATAVVLPWSWKSCCCLPTKGCLPSRGQRAPIRESPGEFERRWCWACIA